MAIFNSYVSHYQRVTLITHTREGSSHSPIPMLSSIEADDEGLGPRGA